MKRYALRTTAIADCRAMWSIGGTWSANTPEVAELLTGTQVDELSKRHPDAQIVDVIVHIAARDIWNAGFRSVIPYDHKGPTSHELRQAARAAGDAAVRMAGYGL